MGLVNGDRVIIINPHKSDLSLRLDGVIVTVIEYNREGLYDYRARTDSGEKFMLNDTSVGERVL